jgi:tetratricopeptide (TPR) repeat protein
MTHAPDPILRRLRSISLCLSTLMILAGLGRPHPVTAAMSSADLPALADSLALGMDDWLSAGDFDTALASTKDLVEIRRRVLGGEHPDVANDLLNLGEVRQSTGDLVAADSLIREALGLNRRLLGDHDPELANSLNGMAAIIEARGQLAEAEPLAREALAIQRQLYPEGDPNTAIFLNSLSDLLARKGHLADEEALAREALDMQRRLAAPGPDVAVALRSLGLIQQAKGDPVAAAASFREAVRIWSDTLGAAHPYTARGMFNLALGRFCEADSLLELAAQRYELARLRAGSGLARATFLSPPTTIGRDLDERERARARPAGSPCLRP